MKRKRERKGSHSDNLLLWADITSLCIDIKFAFIKSNNPLMSDRDILLLMRKEIIKNAEEKYR